MYVLATALAVGLDFGRGPADLDQLLGIFYGLFGVGFVVAVLGHITGLRTLQIAGIVLVFAATALFLVAVGSHG